MAHFLYHPHVWTILIFMIFMGAARSVCVKLFYQFGFEYPIFVSILFVLGQALALPMYYLSKCFQGDDDEEEEQRHPEHDEDDKNNLSTRECHGDIEQGHPSSKPDQEERTEDKSLDHSGWSGGRRQSDHARRGSSLSRASISILANAKRQSIIYSNEDDNHLCCVKQDFFGSSEETTTMGSSTNCHEESSQQRTRGSTTSTHVSKRTREQRRNKLGSSTGLTQESILAAQKYLDRIPSWARPVIPSVFNLANATLRMAALLFVAASIAEMIIGGLELALSVIVARVIRKRQVSKLRWVGVGIVMVGLVLVGGTDVIAGNKGENGSGGPSSSSNQVIGILLIVAQCVMAVLRDISEEIFLQEGGVPAMWLTGMEGCFGLLLGIPLYFVLGESLFDENPLEAMNSLGDSIFLVCWAILLVLVFNWAGIFNVLSTAVTSSMTRNVWKNFRALVVWVVGLVIFYASGNESLGEAWLIPESFIILLGFLVMVSGVVVYYRTREQPPTLSRHQCSLTRTTHELEHTTTTNAGVPACIEEEHVQELSTTAGQLPNFATTSMGKAPAR